MEAVITVIGRDAVGILAKVCTGCAEANVNVEEVSQKMSAIGTQLGVDIRCTRQELYDAMHKV